VAKGTTTEVNKNIFEEDIVKKLAAKYSKTPA
jgi:hypothetical protein